MASRLLSALYFRCAVDTCPGINCGLASAFFNHCESPFLLSPFALHLPHLSNSQAPACTADFRTSHRSESCTAQHRAGWLQLEIVVEGPSQQRHHHAVSTSLYFPSAGHPSSSRREFCLEARLLETIEPYPSSSRHPRVQVCRRSRHGAAVIAQRANPSNGSQAFDLGCRSLLRVRFGLCVCEPLMCQVSLSEKELLL